MFSSSSCCLPYLFKALQCLEDWQLNNTSGNLSISARELNIAGQGKEHKNCENCTSISDFQSLNKYDTSLSVSPAFIPYVPVLFGWLKIKNVIWGKGMFLNMPSVGKRKDVRALRENLLAKIPSNRICQFLCQDP